MPRKASTWSQTRGPGVRISPGARDCLYKVSRRRCHTGSDPCRRPFVWGLPIEGSTASMVIVIVLPLAKLVVEQVYVVGQCRFCLGTDKTPVNRRDVSARFYRSDAVSWVRYRHGESSCAWRCQWKAGTETRRAIICLDDQHTKGQPSEACESDARHSGASTAGSIVTENGNGSWLFNCSRRHSLGDQSRIRRCAARHLSQSKFVSMSCRACDSISARASRNAA